MVIPYAVLKSIIKDILFLGLKIPADFSFNICVWIKIFYISLEPTINFTHKNQYDVILKDGFNDSLGDKLSCEHFIYSGQHESVDILQENSSTFKKSNVSLMKRAYDPY